MKLKQYRCFYFCNANKANVSLTTTPTSEVICLREKLLCIQVQPSQISGYQYMSIRLIISSAACIPDVLTSPWTDIQLVCALCTQQSSTEQHVTVRRRARSQVCPFSFKDTAVFLSHVLLPVHTPPSQRILVSPHHFKVWLLPV